MDGKPNAQKEPKLVPFLGYGNPIGSGKSHSSAFARI